ncbi:MAG: response regulator [Plectolyngbya sp. WJT66-NPBG17]|jgi:CheY-like chemotaxis protein|nr:response regulator [Plectolyngbya sp. WJT66-NPBG17]MBW4528677.1 response regulator [Phormidium tanganyikae FI6-MK23]
MNLTSSLSKPVVLAVDDNLDNLVLLEYQLATVAHCAVVTAATGESAVNLAHSNQPDLILLDILLPDMNGVEVVRQLRQSPATAGIPIVALTALARTEDRDRILDSGCNDYLTKPYDLDDLQAVVIRHLPQYCPL